MAGSSKRKRSSKNRTFDLVTKLIHDGAIKSLANIYTEHIKANDGKCKRNFVKGLVDQAKGSAGRLGITRNDIKNEVRRIQEGEKSNKKKRMHHNFRQQIPVNHLLPLLR